MSLLCFYKASSGINLRNITYTSKIIQHTLHIIQQNFVSLQPQNQGCRNGGMVDTRDLKSLGHNGCAGSSPAFGTANKGSLHTPLLSTGTNRRESCLFINIYTLAPQPYLQPHLTLQQDCKRIIVACTHWDMQSFRSIYLGYNISFLLFPY